jgi:hypothetical protein
MGYIRDSDLKSVMMLPDLKEDEEEEPLEHQQTVKMAM